MNALAEMIDMLRAVPAISALVGTRVYPGIKVPGGKSVFPCILVNRTSCEGTDPDYPIQEVLFDIRCFGADQPAADGVYQAMKTAINGQGNFTSGGAQFYSIFETMAGADLYEQFSDSEVWNYVFSTWTVEIGTA